MNIFSVGDRVSFIHDKLNGTVQQVIDKHKVMVELEDGFTIPVNVMELILIKPAQNITGEQKSTVSVSNVKTYQPPLQKQDERICIAFSAEENSKSGGQAKVSVHLINQTPHKLLFTVFVSGQKSARTVASGETTKYSTQQLVNFPISETEHWREWTVQILRFPETSLLQTQISIYSPLEKCFRLKPANLLNNTQTIPLLGISGFAEDIYNEADKKAETRSEAIETKQDNKEEKRLEPISEVIDLHISSEAENNSIAAQVILQQQLENAQKNIENAIAALMPRLILIHGVGNGVLKMELQKTFMRNKNISRWEEADVNKYGYGATAVYFKY